MEAAVDRPSVVAAVDRPVRAVAAAAGHIVVVAHTAVAHTGRELVVVILDARMVALLEERMRAVGRGLRLVDRLAVGLRVWLEEDERVVD